jgi:hypothetical protein
VFFFKKASNPQKLAEQSKRQQTVDMPAGNYLFLRCSGDEAAAALSAAQFIAWLGIKVSRMLQLITRPMLGARSAVEVGFAILLYTIVPVAITFGWTRMIPDVFKFGVFRFFFSPNGPFLWELNVVYMAFILITVVMPCLFVFGLLGALLIFLTQAVTSWAFGWTRLSTGFFVELAIEPLPFGDHTLVNIDWRTGSIGLDSIVHSWTYGHPVAIRHLQDWIKASLQPTDI